MYALEIFRYKNGLLLLTVFGDIIVDYTIRINKQGVVSVILFHMQHIAKIFLSERLYE